MEPISIVVFLALAAGAVVGREIIGALVKDAYTAMKELIRRRYTVKSAKLLENGSEVESQPIIVEKNSADSSATPLRIYAVPAHVLLPPSWTEDRRKAKDVWDRFWSGTLDQTDDRLSFGASEYARRYAEIKEKKRAHVEPGKAQAGYKPGLDGLLHPEQPITIGGLRSVGASIEQIDGFEDDGIAYKDITKAELHEYVRRPLPLPETRRF